MPRSPRSTRPRAGRRGRSRPAGPPASAHDESSSRLLFTARLAPTIPAPALEADVPAVEEPVTDDVRVEVVPSTPAPTVAPPSPRPTTTAAPSTRVHAEQLVRRSPKLELTPSQALRLASDGPGVLTRPRPKAS